MIESYRKEAERKKVWIEELGGEGVKGSQQQRIVQVNRCGGCGSELLDLPIIHFMCQHSFHQRQVSFVLFFLDEQKERIDKLYDYFS